MKRKTLYLVGAGLIALATALSILLAGTAEARMGRWVTTTLSWGPYNCIWITGVGGTYNDCTGGYDRSSPIFVPVGGTIGIDPTIGNNSWVNCSVVDASTGELLWADGGTKGDGHDINCLRTLNTGNVNG